MHEQRQAQHAVARGLRLLASFAANAQASSCTVVQRCNLVVGCDEWAVSQQIQGTMPKPDDRPLAAPSLYVTLPRPLLVLLI